MRKNREIEEFRGLAGALAVLLTAACGSDGGRDVGPGGGVDSLGGTDGDDGIGTLDDGDDDGGDGTVGGGDDGAGDGDAVFDLGGAAEGTPPEPDDGCKRVDFLFVVDNSVSMEDDQATLVGAFPGFMEAIQSQLAADSDYHILVADTDEWGRCDTANPWVGHDPGSD